MSDRANGSWTTLLNKQQHFTQKKTKNKTIDINMKVASHPLCVLRSDKQFMVIIIFIFCELKQNEVQNIKQYLEGFLPQVKCMTKILCIA